VQRVYQWPPEHHDAIRRIFALKGRNALKTALSNLRDEKRRLKNKNFYMGDDNWKKMQKKWEAEEWQVKSKGGKAAKTCDEGRGKAAYTGGSITTEEHRAREVYMSFIVLYTKV